MTVDEAIKAYPYPIETTEDAVKCSVFVQETLNEVSGQVIPHTKRIVRSDSDFTDGACSGYLCYFHQYQGKLLLDTDIAKLLKDWLADGNYSDRFNAGYIVSFIEGLLEDRDLFAK